MLSMNCNNPSGFSWNFACIEKMKTFWGRSRRDPEPESVSRWVRKHGFHAQTNGQDFMKFVVWVGRTRLNNLVTFYTWCWIQHTQFTSSIFFFFFWVIPSTWLRYAVYWVLSPFLVNFTSLLASLTALAP